MTTADPARRTGASIISTSILTGRSDLTWLVRDEPTAPTDNGWRFLSDADDEEFLADPANLAVVSFDRVALIEPAVRRVYSLPVGSDLQLVVEGGLRRFFDNVSGREVDLGREASASALGATLSPLGTR